MKHPAFQLVTWLAVLLSYLDLHAQGGSVQTRLMNAYHGLIFDQPGQPIVSGNQQSYNIQILDPRTLVLEIAAPPRTPLMVQIQSVQQLWNHAVSPAESIPFAWEAAFCNAGINDERMARQQAIPLDVNQNQFQFEMNDYQSIPGNPEPIDDRVKAYLYVYGRLGPVGMVTPGFYTNTINIQVWY
jgi:hypothetical protein